MDDRQISGSGRLKLISFSKDVLVYSAGNGLLLIFGFIQTIIIPKYLSVEDYGYWQLFILYSIYVGILHLGFNDGILLRWAGKELNQIGSEIKIALKFLILEQLGVIIPLALIISFLLQPPLLYIGLMLIIFAFIMNLANLLIFTTQATRQFKLLTAMEVGRGFLFLAIIVSLVNLRHFEYEYIIVAWLLVYLLLMVAFIIRYSRYVRGSYSYVNSLTNFGKKNINTGIFILLGNFVFVIVCSVDRLLVSSFFAIEQFAIYAFAMTVVQVVFIFIKGVADVLFPHLSTTAPAQRPRVYQEGKRLLILFWALFLCSYFPLTVLIEFFLPYYTGSFTIIKILMGTIGFTSLIFILHVNYYRLYRKQRQYFLWGITTLMFTVLLAMIAIKTFGTLESVSIAILISFCIWYIINELGLKSTTGESRGNNWRGLMSMGCYFASFWCASFLSTWFIVQMLLYMGFFLIISLGFFRADLCALLLIIKKRVK